MTRTQMALSLLCVSIVVAFVPTYLRLADKTWQTDEGSHGPLIAAAILWLVWSERDKLNLVEINPRPSSGWCLLLAGLFMMVIARSQAFLSIEAFSQIVVIAGSLLLVRGWATVRAFAFPLLFLVFLVPLPGSIVDAITLPLKTFISDVVVEILYGAGLPVAQSGVVIMIGPYQLLVKDACAGMNSIFTLSAIGVLYLHLHPHATRMRKIVLSTAIVPIAVGANVVRVMCLVLLAYFDDLDAIEGYYHDLTGIFLFVVALILLFILDCGIGSWELIWQKRFPPVLPAVSVAGRRSA